MHDERAHELESLCRACGLCCDATLFGLVPLTSDEVARARRRLPLVRGGRYLAQPCTALTVAAHERVCAHYDARPEACRSFVCVLFERHRREGGPLRPRLDAVARVRSLLAALADGVERVDRAGEVEELRARLDADFRRAP